MGQREDQIKRIQQIERIKAHEAQLAADDLPVQSEMNPLETVSNALTEKLLPGGMKALGYAGGAVRSGLMKAIDQAGGTPGLPAGEAKAGLSPLDSQQIPGWSEYMRRKGVPEGASLSDFPPMAGKYAEPGRGKWYQPEKGGLLDPSLRGTVGTGLDIATDPLTWLGLSSSPGARKVLQAAASKGLLPKAATKFLTTPVSEVVAANQGARAMERGNLNKTMADRIKDAATYALHPDTYTKPLTTATDTAGRKLYRGALRPLDLTSVEGGKMPISSRLLQEKGPTTSGGVHQFLSDRSAALEKKASGLANEMDAIDPVIQNVTPGSVPGSYPPVPALIPGDTTGGVDVADAMGLGKRAVTKLADRPTIADTERALQQNIAEHENLGRVSRSHAVTLKGDLYRMQPENAYGNAVRTGPGAGVRGQQARGLKEALEAGHSNPQLPAKQQAKLLELGHELKSTTEPWGEYLTALPAAEDMAIKAGNKAFLRPTDAAMGGAALSAGALKPALAAKKVYDTARLVPVRTGLGWFLHKLSQGAGAGEAATLVDAYLRSQMMQGMQEARPSPWSLLNDEEKK